MLLCPVLLMAQQNYGLTLKASDSLETALLNSLNLRTGFPNRAACNRYVDELPGVLRTRGYVTASLDSTAYDSTTARVWLYLGRKYTWTEIRTTGATDSALMALRINPAQWRNRAADFNALFQLQQRILYYYQERGYPFTKVQLDSIQINGNEVSAVLHTSKGFIHKIDSIRINGKARISKGFLQRHLNIPNGSLFRKSTLDAVGRKLTELPFVQQNFPPDLTMLGGSSVLNLYLQPKKSSQVNVLLGIIPAPISALGPQQRTKLLVTGDVNLLL
ncbi:MAG: hypothetical protein JNM68_14885, partial [Dinghuibacter sp.]|nr:hypothetical protein [Dinghuibacter sp.]